MAQEPDTRGDAALAVRLQFAELEARAPAPPSAGAAGPWTADVLARLSELAGSSEDLARAGLAAAQGPWWSAALARIRVRVAGTDEGIGAGSGGGDSGDEYNDGQDDDDRAADIEALALAAAPAADEQEGRTRKRMSARGPACSDTSAALIVRGRGTAVAHVLPRFFRAAGSPAAGAGDAAVVGRWEAPPSAIPVRCGNELLHSGAAAPTVVPLEHYLRNVRLFLTRPESWPGASGERAHGDLFCAARDGAAPCRAQACFLPVADAARTAEFAIALHNPLALPGDPAVLALVCTHTGTTAVVCDDPTRTHLILCNDRGVNRPFRTADIAAADVDGGGGGGGEAAGVVLVVEVPLRQRRALPIGMSRDAGESEGDSGGARAGPPVIGAPARELGGLDVERDERFPIRVTVLFLVRTTGGFFGHAAVHALADLLSREALAHEFNYLASGFEDEGAEGALDEGEGVAGAWWDEFWRAHASNFSAKVREARARERILGSPQFKHVRVLTEEMRQKVVNELRAFEASLLAGAPDPQPHPPPPPPPDDGPVIVCR